MLTVVSLVDRWCIDGAAASSMPTAKADAGAAGVTTSASGSTTGNSARGGATGAAATGAKPGIASVQSGAVNGSSALAAANSYATASGTACGSGSEKKPLLSTEKPLSPLPGPAWLRPHIDQKAAWLEPVSRIGCANSHGHAERRVRRRRGRFLPTR